MLARSPKLHRPRGPYCLRAACDGCLVRVDGVPNVMACRHRVRGGETVETQNVIGSREVDLLSATDFMFPHGIDHHRLFAGVRGVSTVVQRLARRIAGLGRLPDEPLGPRPARERSVPVLIVGGGAAGLSAACELGDRALLVDDALALGGSFALLDPERAAALGHRARGAGAELLSESTALGVYREPERADGALTVPIATERGLLLVSASAVLLATGGHEPLPDFPGNDLPGVFSARAGLLLLAGGVLPADTLAVVGAGRFAERALSLLGTHGVLHVPEPQAVKEARGRLELKALLIREGQRTRRLRVGAVLVDLPAVPAVELAVQGGGRVHFVAGRGYALELDDQGRAAPGVWCAGTLSGADDSIASGRNVAERIRGSLSAP